MPKRRTAALGLLIGGLAVMLGTVLPWTPSGSPLLLVARMGLEFSEGAMTLVLGLVTSVVGADALRLGGASPVWVIGLAAGLLTVLILTGRFAESVAQSGYWWVEEVPEEPASGLYVVMLGAFVGVIASLRLSKTGRLSIPSI